MPSLLAELLPVLLSGRDGVLMVLAVYVDESGRAEEGVFAVAGYVVDPSRVARFDREWRKALASVGPQLQRFHMNEFAHKKAPYDTLTEDKRGRFLARLASLINGNTRSFVRVAVDLNAFASLTAEESRAWGAEKPYEFGVQLCLLQALQWRAAFAPTHHVAYVLDDVPRGQGKGRLDEQFKKIKDDPESRRRYQIDSVTWMPSESAPLLQAADFLVWEVAREAARKLGRSKWPRRKSADALLSRTTPTAPRGRAVRTHHLVDEKFLQRFRAADRIGLRTVDALVDALGGKRALSR